MSEESIILRVEIDQEQAIKDTVELTKQIDRLTAKQKELDRSTEEGAIAYAENAASLRALKAEQAAMNKVIDNSIITRNKEIKSINEARANVKLLTEQRNKLDISTTEGKEKLEKLNSEIDKNNKFIKDNVDAYTKQKIGIGDYKTAIVEAAKDINIFGVNLGQLKSGLENAKKGIDITKAGFSGFNGVLKASVLGVVITLVAGLISAFTRFEPLMDKVKSVMAAANAVIDVFVERLTRVGRGLVEIMNGNFSEGINQIRNSFDGMAKSMADNAKEAFRLREELDALEDRQRAQIVLNAQAEKQVSQLLLQAKNRTLSEQQRLALLDKAAKIERETFERQKKLQEDIYKNALANAKRQTQLSEAEIEELLTNTQRREELERRLGTLQSGELDKLAKMKADIIRLEKDSVSVQEKIVNRRDALIQEEAEKRAKAVEKQKKAIEDLRKKEEEALRERVKLQKRNQEILEQGNEYRMQKLKEEGDEIKFNLNEQQTALVNALMNRNITQQQYDEQLLQIRLDALEKEKDLLIKQGEDTSAIELNIAEQRLAIAQNRANSLKKINEQEMKSAQLVAQSAQSVINSLASTFQQGTDDMKGIALANVGINLGTAIGNLVATTSAPSPDNLITGGISGFVKYAAFLTQVLTAIGQARSIIGGAAAGGGTFRTKGPTMLLVGDNPGGVEEISVKPISGKGKTVVNPKGNLIAMAGGGTLIADGGTSTSKITQEVTQQFNMMQMIKNIPAPILKITDLNRVQANKNKAIKVSEFS